MDRAKPTTDRRGLVGRLLLGVLMTVIAIIVIAAVAGIALSYRVDGNSMNPTLSEGDRILLDPLSDSANIERFDIAVIRRPNGSLIIKRVIGLPGDSIRVDPTPGGDSELRVRVAGNGAWLRVDGPAWSDQWRDEHLCCGPDGKDGSQGTAAVPTGSLFVLGDNPDASDDSRVYGWIKSADVAGRIGLRVYPVDRIGMLDGEFRLVSDES